MVGICKILFDLSFFYALSGFYLYIFTENYPSVWGIPVLMVAALVYFALGALNPAVESDEGTSTPKRVVTVLCCAIPGLLFIFAPTLPQILQYLPAWAFFGYTIWNGLTNIDRRMFEDHYSFTGKLFFLLLFGILAISTKRVGGAVTGAIPYLIIYLLTGVCLMRILREEGKLTRSRNVAVLLVLLVSSVILATLQTPQLILSAIGFVYRNIISWAIIGVAVGIAAAIYALFRAIASLFSFIKPGNHEINIDMSGSGQEIFGDEITLREFNPPLWLQVLSIALLVLAIAFVIFLIMRKLLGKRAAEKKSEFYTEERENLNKRGKSIRGGVFRPKDPRLAVRWYYCKYLREGSLKYRAKPVAADTSLSVLRKYRIFFPEHEAEQLRELYVAARYQLGAATSKSAADKAGALWGKMKTGVRG